MEGCLRAAEARILIRHVLSHGQIVYSQPHALQRLAERGISMVDCENVLRAGVVEEPEYENGGWRYKVWTRKMTVVVEFLSRNDLLIVTAWRQR